LASEEPANIEAAGDPPAQGKPGAQRALDSDPGRRRGADIAGRGCNLRVHDLVDVPGHRPDRTGGGRHDGDEPIGDLGHVNEARSARPTAAAVSRALLQAAYAAAPGTRPPGAPSAAAKRNSVADGNSASNVAATRNAAQSAR
jgi:hypothetical protein